MCSPHIKLLFFFFLNKHNVGIALVYPGLWQLFITVLFVVCGCYWKVVSYFIQSKILHSLLRNAELIHRNEQMNEKY